MPIKGGRMNIPTEVSNTIMRNNTGNVILLVMSTLPKEKAVETYQYEEDLENHTYKGVSQLEAGTKYYLQKLALRKEKVDKIVILSSKEALNNMEEQYDNSSAVEVYKSRVESFIKHEEANCFGANDEKKVLKESCFVGKDLYSDDVESLFTILSEQNRVELLLNAAQEIRNVSESINLYLDMQGGDRNAIPSINSVATLLSDLQVTIVDRVSVAFNKNNDVQPIRNAMDDYNSYGLVTAYQIFREYGSGDQLVEYFQSNKDTNTKDVTEAIKEVSDAIRICNVSGFDEGLVNLKKSIDNYKELREESSELGFIINQIESDYGDLLEDSSDQINKPLKYVKQIRWCLKKNYIQQAITIFESKMPTEFVWNAMCYYCGNKKDKGGVIRNFEKIYNWIKANKKNEIYLMEDLNHFWIRNYYRYKDCLTKDIRCIYGISYKEYNEYRDRYTKICKMRNIINHAAVKANPGGFRDTIIKSSKNKTYTLGDYISKISKFLDDFEKTVSAIPQEKKDKVIDLS